MSDVAIVTASALTCATYLLLLIGVASRGRIIAGCVMFLLSTTVPLAVVRFAPSSVQPPGQLRVQELGTSLQSLTGTALDYRVALAGDGWHAIAPSAKERITPRSDAVATNRITGAVVRVYVDLKPGITPSSRTYLDGTLERLAKQTAPVERVGELQPYPGRSRVARVSWNYEGVLWTGFCATVVGDGWGIELDASAPTPQFAALERDLRTIVDSLRIADNALKPPDGLVVTRSKKFAEPDSPFQLQLAGDGWHDTPATAMKKELGPNSKVRGWKQPYLGTHLYAWHERANGAKLEPGAIVGEWIRNLEATNGKKARRVAQHAHSAGRRAWLQEVELSSSDATSTAWFLVLVNGGEVIFTSYEVPANVSEELRQTALATLGSVRFSK